MSLQDEQNEFQLAMVNKELMRDAATRTAATTLALTQAKLALLQCAMLYNLE